MKTKAEKSERAWLVANLMASSGNLKKGTTLTDLYKSLMGEEREKPRKVLMTDEDAQKLLKRFGG